MVSVELKHWTNTNPYQQASWSAKNCYNPQETVFGEKPLDVKKQLFETSHHTTHSHFYFTFFIEGISISDIDFGLHLLRAFYNSEQRSGRFCIDMFENPDYQQILTSMKYYWPELTDKRAVMIMDFIKFGISVFQENVEKATSVAREFISIERPRASSKYVEVQGEKFAKEQMRNFVTTFFPTGNTFTINLLALISLYHVAWNRAMLDITQKMADQVIEMWPEMEYAFQRGEEKDYLICASYEEPAVVFSPREVITNINLFEHVVYPEPKDLHPIDTLFYHPRFMDNNLSEIISRVYISLATMGQDQRHRTIDQGWVHLTNGFYLPPVAQKIGLEQKAQKLIRMWVGMRGKIPEDLRIALAPYGAVVSYIKKTNLNALFHEQLKRLCWCTQEEIYNLNLQKRQQVIGRFGERHRLVSMFSPFCVRCGKCAEGKRYCGRDMEKSSFLQRKV